LGKVIDVDFPQFGTGRWCLACDEPFPDGTAMCPRCGGALSSAVRHRAEMQTQARRAARRVVAAGGGLLLLLIALVAWLILGGPP
jgi:hypothetical protein